MWSFIFLQNVGRGAFGAVYKACWREKFIVALKIIESEAQKNSFIVEVIHFWIDKITSF